MPFVPLNEEEKRNPPKSGFTPLTQSEPKRGFTALGETETSVIPEQIERPPLTFPEQQPAPFALGALPPEVVSQETLPVNPPAGNWMSNVMGVKPALNNTAPNLGGVIPRQPEDVISSLSAGDSTFSPEELGKIILGLEKGALENPAQIQELLSPLLSDEGRSAVNEAAMVREILNERKDSNIDLIPGGDGTETFMEGLVKGLTFNELGDKQQLATGNNEVDKLLSVEHRASEIEEEARRSENPVQAFGGEVLGSVAPFVAGVKILRGLRAARGLAPVEATTEGYIVEGAKVGGTQSAAFKPEGAENMSLEQEMTGRAIQGGVGIVAGAILDFGAIKLGDWASKTFTALKDKRFASALSKEAEEKGFSNEEEYLSSLVEFVDTPDGVLVSPRTEVTSSLPNTKTDAKIEEDVVSNTESASNELARTPDSRNGTAADNLSEGELPAIEGQTELPPFTTEHDIRLQAHHKKAAAQGLNETQAKAFEPEAQRDHLTGFQGRRDREATLKRAIDYVEETDQPGQYVAMDIINLGGLNNRFGEPGADKIFRDFTSIIEEELAQVGGHVNFFRHGGDEVSATVLGVEEDILSAAMQRINARSTEYATQNNLMDIPHTKGKKSGTGLNYGISSIKAGRSLDETLELAHNRLERTKERDYVDIDVVEKARASRPDQQAVGKESLYLEHDGEGGNVRGRGDSVENGTPATRGENRSAKTEQTTSVSLSKDGQFRVQSPEGDKPYSHNEKNQIFVPEGSDATSAIKDFGPRVKHVETGTFPTGLQKVKSAADVAHVVAPIRKDAQESFITVITNDAGNVLRLAKLHKGDQLQATIDPTLVAGTISNTPKGTRAYIAHNHPTGNVKQSEADHKLATKVSDLLDGTGVKLEGSLVIVPGGRTHSKFDAGTSVESVEATTTAPRKVKTPVTERKLFGGDNKHDSINSTEAAHKALAEAGGEREGVLLLDTENKPKAFIELSDAELRELRTGQGGGSRKLFKAMDETNADAFIVRANSKAAAGNMNAFAEQSGKFLVDVISSDGKSLRASPEGIPSQSTFYSNPFVPVIKQMTQDIGLYPGRSAAAAFAGGTVGATNSEYEVGTAKWWADVVLGAGLGVGVFQAGRATRLLGKGSIVDNSLAHLGRYIEGLPLIGRGPSELRGLKNKQRLMQQLLDRQTEEVGKYLLKNFNPSERAMMADLIESRGIVKDLNLIHRQAEALDNHLTFAAEKMKELGMLKGDLETGGYLHRYYAKHLGLDKMFKQAKKQSLSGSYSIARGTDDNFNLDYLSAGARDITDKIQSTRKALDKLQSKKGDLSKEDYAKEVDLKKELKELQKTELAEFTGEQNGIIRSFIFAKDEVARVSGQDGHSAVLAHLDRQKQLGASPVPTVPGVKDLSPTDRVWVARGHNGKHALLHRDWTKAERRSWGEIDDAGYRYVRGMAEVSHDLSLATLFDTVSRNSDWVSDAPRVSGRKNKEWIEVPKTKVGKGSPLQQYGNLAGKYVRPDVWNGIKGYGRALFGDSRSAKTYRAAVNKWKLYKTVYNPVTHLNNSYSNVEMLLMGGYKPNVLAKGIKLMRQGEENALWREARDNGLFGTDWATSLLRTNEGVNNQVLNEIADQLRTQPEIVDADIVTTAVMDLKHWWLNSVNSVKGAKTTFKTGHEVAKAMGAPVIKGLRFIKKPIDVAAHVAQRAYKFEDEVFKMGVFQAERAKGKSPQEAVKTAQGLFFDYSDVPEAVKIVRDFPIGSPFISYTYFAIPAIAKNIAQRPEAVLALVAGYEAFNYGAMVSEGMGPGEYWATEQAEEEVSPPWEKGRSLWGAKNTVHIPGMESYRLAVGRAHALGNPFMSEAGGREKLPTVPYAGNFWGSSAFGSNPTHALLDVLVNEDWKGKEIYHKAAPTKEKAKKIGAYLYQAWSPSNPATPGGYHQSKIIDGFANDLREDKNSLVAPIVDSANAIAATLGMEGFTGLDRMDNEINSRDAMLGSVGIKLRPLRLEQSEDFKLSSFDKNRKEKNDWFKKQTQLYLSNRITQEQLNKYEKQLESELLEIDKKEENVIKAGKYLKKSSPNRQ